MMYREVEGDLIDLALKGDFDVIGHGVNCFNKQKNGIAKVMVENFGTNLFPMELKGEGDYNKLGNIDSQERIIYPGRKIWITNCYTQYDYRNHTTQRNLNYNALQLCLDKINYEFKGMKIGLPKIGCHLAGGDWNIVKAIIEVSLIDCYVTIVILPE